jgi:pimeloyl-ACP methyl ester carboxylesterase
LNKRSNAAKSARIFIIPRAGHQLMIDNPVGFHDAIREALADYEE